MKTTLLIALVCSALTTVAQLPEQHLSFLQKGVLLIQMNTSINQIKVLQERGLEQQAQAIVLKNQAYHQALREAFRKHYNFSSFHFIYNMDTDSILAGRTENKVYDSRGEVVNFVQAGRPIYILQIGKFIGEGEFSSVNNVEGFIIKKIENGRAIPIKSREPFFYATPTEPPTNARKERRFQRNVSVFNRLLWEEFRKEQRKYKRKIQN